MRSVLVRIADPVRMEDPGYPMTRLAPEIAGARVVPVRVEDEGLARRIQHQRGTQGQACSCNANSSLPHRGSIVTAARLTLLTWATKLDPGYLKTIMIASSVTLEGHCRLEEP